MALIFCRVEHHNEELTDVSVRKPNGFKLRIAAKAKRSGISYSEPGFFESLADRHLRQILAFFRISSGQSPDRKVTSMLQEDRPILPGDDDARARNKQTSAPYQRPEPSEVAIRKCHMNSGLQDVARDCPDRPLSASRTKTAIDKNHSFPAIPSRLAVNGGYWGESCRYPLWISPGWIRDRVGARAAQYSKVQESSAL